MQFAALILCESFKKVRKSEGRWAGLVSRNHCRKALCPFTVQSPWLIVDSWSRELRLGRWGNFGLVAKTGSRTIMTGQRIPCDNRGDHSEHRRMERRESTASGSEEGR